MSSQSVQPSSDDNLSLSLQSYLRQRLAAAQITDTEKWRLLNERRQKEEAERRRNAERDRAEEPLRLLRARYRELETTERELTSFVEGVNPHTDVEQLFQARGRLQAVRDVMRTFPDEAKPVKPSAAQLEQRRQETRARMVKRIAELARQAEGWESAAASFDKKTGEPFPTHLASQKAIDGYYRNLRDQRDEMLRLAAQRRALREDAEIKLREFDKESVAT